MMEIDVYDGHEPEPDQEFKMYYDSKDEGRWGIEIPFKGTRE